MLAIEMYAHDQGIELIEPTHAYDGDKIIPLRRSCEQYRLDPPLWVSSSTQFVDYLVIRGLSVVSAHKWPLSLKVSPFNIC
ncbi:hypothetical protein ALP94_00519 [Pseudomonas savastanoi pv. glycinea]|nr:hypothetical protein ALP94_00519 [Pseudomonas savastanoi pv. glycinea]